MESITFVWKLKKNAGNSIIKSFRSRAFFNSGNTFIKFISNKDKISLLDTFWKYGLNFEKMCKHKGNTKFRIRIFA